MLLYNWNIKPESTLHLRGSNKFSTQHGVQLTDVVKILFHTNFKLYTNENKSLFSPPHQVTLVVFFFFSFYALNLNIQ